jgi:hypothetical protein
MADTSIEWTQKVSPDGLPKRVGEVPVGERERLGFGVPHRFEVLDLPAGPRDLPSWAWDAAINWREGFSNRPDYMIRCRRDPLAFTRDGSPVWRMFEYESTPGEAGGQVGRKVSRGWIAEQDGVASCHYHSGAIRMVDFEENVTNERGEIVWIERPDYKTGKQGVPQTRKFSMLATDKQEGYGGAIITITLAEQEIPIWNAEQCRSVKTLVEAGTKLRLRGPWHGGPPAGYHEVTYCYPTKHDPDPGNRWFRPWHERGGFFGLCIKPEIKLAILTTFVPHVEWAICTESHKTYRDEIEVRRTIEPLRPETGLPKRWLIEPWLCEHDFLLSNYSTPRVPRPADECRFCGERRDDSWAPLDYRGQPLAWFRDRDPLYHFPYGEPREKPAAPVFSWPTDVKVPPTSMRGLNFFEYREAAYG